MVTAKNTTSNCEGTKAMASKKALPKKRQKKSTGKQQNIWTGLGIVVAGILLVGFFFYWILSGMGGDMGEQAKMRDHLKDKYGQEFVVGKPEREASGLGVEGYLEAEAYPDNDKSLKFIVRDASHSGVIDNYPGAVWSREETKRLTPIIRKLFGNDVKPSIEVETIGTIDIRGAIPSFKTGVKTHKKSIRYNLTIIGPETDTSSVNKEKVSRQIMDLRDKLPLNQTTHTIDYLIRLNDTHSYGVSLSGEDLLKIQSVGELINQFKEYRRASL